MKQQQRIAPDDEPILSPEEILRQNERERRWLLENNAISAVIDGPVEDLQGVSLPADLHQGRPPAHSAGETADGEAPDV